MSTGEVGGAARQGFERIDITIREGEVKNPGIELKAYKGVTAFFARLFGVAVQVPLGKNYSITIDRQSARDFFDMRGASDMKKDLVENLIHVIRKNEGARKSVEDVLNLRGAEANEFEKQIFTDVSKDKLLYTPESIFVSKDVLERCNDALKSIGITQQGVSYREIENYCEVSTKDFEYGLKHAKVDKTQFGNIDKVEDPELKRFLEHVIEMVTPQHAGIQKARREREMKGEAKMMGETPTPIGAEAIRLVEQPTTGPVVPRGRAPQHPAVAENFAKWFANVGTIPKQVVISFDQLSKFLQRPEFHDNKSVAQILQFIQKQQRQEAYTFTREQVAILLQSLGAQGLMAGESKVARALPTAPTARAAVGVLQEVVRHAELSAPAASGPMITDVTEESRRAAPEVGSRNVHLKQLSIGERQQVVEATLEELQLDQIPTVKEKIKKLMGNEFITNNIQDFPPDACKTILGKLGFIRSHMKSQTACKRQIDYILLKLREGKQVGSAEVKESIKIEQLLNQLSKRCFH